MLTDPDIELLRRRFEQQLPRFEEAALWAERRVRELLHRHAVMAITSSRAKSPESFERRLRRDAADERWVREARGERFDRLMTDVAGCRVMVYRAIDVDRARRALKSGLELAPVDRCEQEHRKESGYEATHLLLEVASDAARHSLRGTTVEVQVVTLAGHLFNELEHSAVYKQLDPLCRSAVTESIRALRDASSAADDRARLAVAASAKARHEAAARVTTAVELAMELECALGRPVHGEFAVVFEFVESVARALDDVGAPPAGDLLAMHRRGCELVASRRVDGIDDATAILLALRERHPDEFSDFARMTRRESPMVMLLLDQFGSAEKPPT
ncbi:MAG: RelA/SpoT domain-containing protein [Planctomycetes bacterium]|nr:RelA/SpoT domain-containing protein [Planctomycetota bacterium]